jgi:hypothetical protein
MLSDEVLDFWEKEKLCCIVFRTIVNLDIYFCTKHQHKKLQ